MRRIKQHPFIFRMKTLVAFGVFYVAIVVVARPSIDDDAAAQVVQRDFHNDGVNPWYHR